MFSHGCGAAAEGCKYRPGPTAQLVEHEGDDEEEEVSSRRFDSKHYQDPLHSLLGRRRMRRRFDSRHYLARRSDTGDKYSDRLTCKTKGHTLIMLIMLIGSDHTRLGTSRNLFYSPLPSMQHIAMLYFCVLEMLKYR